MVRKFYKKGSRYKTHYQHCYRLHNLPIHEGTAPLFASNFLRQAQLLQPIRVKLG